MNAQTPPRDRSSGFTLLETVISLALLLTVMAITLSFFMQFGNVMNTESNTLASQQTARLAIDDMTRKVRTVGFGTSRVSEFNPASWQKGLIYGGSHFIAFNADNEAVIGALPTSQSLALPGGGTYTGEGIGATLSGAETYVYTLDANGDNAVTAADRSAAVTGSFNPAADTPNPMDFALFTRVLGFNGTDYGGTLEPLAANLFTNATSDSVYPDSTTPPPLLTYWLSEDLNEDGALQDQECVNDVIGFCPPVTERAPVLYLWGDTNFDGVLSEAEKAALTTMEVGSATWSKNRLATSNVYKSSTLVGAIIPASSGANQITVNDGTKFGPGYQVRIGVGSAAEVATVSQVSTAITPHRIMLTDYPTKPHAAGDSITILPSTLLSAVRSVGITFAAITSVADTVGGKQVAGRVGRKGTNGLDYKVTPYSRQAEVPNISTAALVNDGSGSIETICPIMLINQCNAAASASSIRYKGFTGGSGVTFLVTDMMGNPVPGKTITVTNSALTIGTLGAATATTDTNGIASVSYALVGALGNDTVTATATCINSAGATNTYTATRQIQVYQVTAAAGSDCLSTISSRTPSPSSSVLLTVTNSSGPVSGHDLGLGLWFDSGYLPPSPDFTQLRGGLTITSGPSGNTGTTGSLAPLTVTTNGSGQIAGTVAMTLDGPATGARLNLVAQPAAAGTCSMGGSLTTKFDFFKLALASTVPSAGCTAGSPCTIAANSNPPQVQATLTIGGHPATPANLQFTRNDTVAPAGAVSRIAPTTGLVVSDASGQGTLRVMNNGAPSITTMAPLSTQIDVSATAPSLCSAGTIVSSSSKAQFDFTGPVGSCTTSLVQAYVSKISTKKICLHVKNTNAAGGCSLRMTGMTASLYNAAGTALDTTAVPLFQQIIGGAVTASPTCSTSTALGQVQLNKDNCKSPTAKLANGEPWTFRTFGACDPPIISVPPGQYFTISDLEFPANYPTNRKLTIQVSFVCEGTCDCGVTDSASFDVISPP